MEDKKKKIQIKFIRFYETAKKCLLLIDIIFNKLRDNIDNLESVENDKEYQTCELYINLFGFIDFTHRFCQIIDTMPLLSKSKPEVKKLNKTLKIIKDCRNYLQHMKEHLGKEEMINYPILGAFSWISDNKNYIVLPSQSTEKHSTAGIAFDTRKNVYLCKYQFNIGGFEVKIDKVYDEIKEFWSWFETISHIEPKEIKDYSWGKPNILCSMFQYADLQGC